MRRRTLGLVVAALTVATACQAQEARAWVGKKVVLKYKGQLTMGDRVVDDGSVFRSYTVGGTEGGRLLLVAGGVRGYVATSSVVPFDQAIGYYNREIRDDSHSPGAYINRGLILREKGEFDLAIADFDEAVRLDPRGASGYSNRGNARNSKRDFDRAIVDFDQALTLDPKDATVYANRGHSWNSKGDHDRAIADFDAAIRLDPKIAHAYNGRGYSWDCKRRYDRSIADFGEAIRLDPHYEWAHNNRAWTLATCPDAKYRDGKKAVESATRACELSAGSAVNCLGTLAAAYAESGDFAKAVACQERANGLYKDGDDRRKGQERLKLYRQKTPYRAEG